MVDIMHGAIIADDLTGVADSGVQLACLRTSNTHELNICSHVPQMHHAVVEEGTRELRFDRLLRR